MSMFLLFEELTILLLIFTDLFQLSIKNIELLLQDECSIFAKPIEICPPKKHPVCSKQGVTYFNICTLVMPETALKHKGECKPE
uniref:Kazal-like domain-containing protein n=1 Tax=Naja naja TaxID=35670 RepID=A0A8C6V8M5_NAJNA